MEQLTNALRSFLNDDSGATMVEYGLLVALIAVVVAVAAITLGNNVSTRFNNTAACVATPNTTTCK